MITCAIIFLLFMSDMSPTPQLLEGLTSRNLAFETSKYFISFFI